MMGRHEADWDPDCAADGAYDFPTRYKKYRTPTTSGFEYDDDYEHGRHKKESHD